MQPRSRSQLSQLFQPCYRAITESFLAISAISALLSCSHGVVLSYLDYFSPAIVQSRSRSQLFKPYCRVVTENPAILNYFSPIIVQSRSRSQLFQPCCHAATKSFSAISALLPCNHREFNHSHLFQPCCRAATENSAILTYFSPAIGQSRSRSQLFKPYCRVVTENSAILTYFSLAAVQPRSRSQPFQPSHYTSVENPVVLSYFSLVAIQHGLLSSINGESSHSQSCQPPVGVILSDYSLIVKHQWKIQSFSVMPASYRSHSILNHSLLSCGLRDILSRSSITACYRMGFEIFSSIPICFIYISRLSQSQPTTVRPCNTLRLKYLKPHYEHRLHRRSVRPL